MKILSLHCDYIKFKPLQKALKTAEITEEEKQEKYVEQCLVILVAVEKQDETAAQLVKNIEELSEQVKCKNIVLYPYAHLSSNLGNPTQAEKILKQAEQELKNKKFQIIRAPFGYYKEFELKCKGHPLSELSRTF